MRYLSALLFAGAFASSLWAQSAEPPTPSQLDQLGLKTEWVNAVPLTGERDGVATVQVADNRQVFVQTKGGLLVAFDAATGERQWSFRYDFNVATPFTVAFNDQYVIAFSVSKLYGIQRTTGILDFTLKLPLAPSAPPFVDADTIYVIMSGNRLAAYELPPGLLMPDPKLIKAANRFDSATNKPGLVNPADAVAARYPAATRNLNMPADQFDHRSVRLTADAAGSFGSAQRTASLAVVASLRQPYKAFDSDGRYLNSSPSLSTLPSLRQPYHLEDPNGKTTQRTPSLSAIPPSLVSVIESTNLRPRGIELKMKWVYGSTVPLNYAPLLTRSRLWGLSNSQTIVALFLLDGSTQVDATLSAPPTAAAGQAEDVAYVPQEDGYLVAVDLDGGAPRAVRTIWKANVGGLMNYPPVPSKNGVYQAGSNNGIVNVDRTLGEVVWRTENASDRLLAMNDEHLYASDYHGRIYVYNRNIISEKDTKRSYAVASASLPQFTHAVTNAKTDRIYLISRGGLFVCLRDSAPKYAAIQTMAPPKQVPVKPKTAPAPKVEKPAEAPKN